MEPIIQVSNVTFAYEDQNLPAIRNLSMSINKNEWVSIVGHNGSGKSTLVKLLCGIETMQEGRITVNQLVLNEENIQSVHKYIGIVFQNPDNQFVGATVEDDIAFGLENHGVPYDEMHRRVDAALQSVNMVHLKRHEPHHLSGGQKQRVAIAGVMALQPEIIILDEATSMLDPEGRIEILNILKYLKDEYQLTVIHITHHLEETLSSDKIIVMNQGEAILSGTPEAIYQQADTLIDIGLDLPFEMKVNRIIFGDNALISQEELLDKL
ncbi:energy-coupling factor transporter ATPase [Macrococcus equi]|uniref:energy-coupling factor transporter ATPase n=1 Tax=Macrococcus equi TaxID=3395462 RepID=UPI0039BE36BC